MERIRPPSGKEMKKKKERKKASPVSVSVFLVHWRSSRGVEMRSDQDHPDSPVMFLEYVLVQNNKIRSDPSFQ
jgi:hypothetical protein